MINLTVKYDVRSTITQLEQVAELLGDLTWLWNEVSHPWWLAHVEANFATHGRHSGQDWSFAGEPKYAAYKARVADNQDPLRWGAGHEQIYPSSTDESHPLHIWRTDEQGYVIGSNAPNLEDMQAGGVGPFGEPFPGRDPFYATPQQLDELARLEQQAIDQRLREIGFKVWS